MKNIFLIFVSILLILSCSDDDNSLNNLMESEDFLVRVTQMHSDTDAASAAAVVATTSAAASATYMHYVINL